MSDSADSEFTIFFPESGGIDVKFVCPRDPEDKVVTMDSCEATCPRYYTCQKISDANDYLVEEGH